MSLNLAHYGAQSTAIGTQESQQVSILTIMITYPLTLWEYKIHKRDSDEPCSVMATSCLHALRKFKEMNGGSTSNAYGIEICSAHMVVRLSESVVNESDWRVLISNINSR